MEPPPTETVTPSPAAAPVAAEQQLGRYRLLELLGEGGMATVWRAEHREDDGFLREVAVKCLKIGLATPELRARFLREQQILAGLTHPYIARLYDVGISSQGVPYIVMERIDGLPVTGYCDRHALSLRDRLSLFRRVLEAVAYAHQNLIVHRDLKPANILVTPDGVPKLLDFGIAKPLDDEETTRTQLRALTPSYAAPEQLRGETVTTATDVYALGVVLHELLTGIKPVRRDAEAGPATDVDPPLASQTVLRRRRMEDPESLARARGFTDTRHLAQALRGDLDTLVAGALRADPGRRYRDAATFDADLERFLRHLPLRMRAAGPGYRAAKFLRRNWLATGAVAGTLAALAVGTGLALWQAGRARQQAARAGTALAETRQALSRAEALREFLLDLFRSAEPNRPRDQLPSTEEILALGAARALDQRSAPPAERVDMLMTIGEIYRNQQSTERARPLLEAAVKLAREHRDERPEDLALALWLRAALAMDERELERADALLREAEAIVEGSPESWSTFAKVRLQRAWAEQQKGNPVAVIGLVGPLYAQMLDRDGVNANLRAEAMVLLAGSHNVVGDLDAAASLYASAIETVERARGPRSLAYVSTLYESISSERFLGRFEAAESRARQAIALCDEIFGEDRPSTHRARAHYQQAQTLLARGRFEPALAALEKATSEQARSIGSRAADWEYRYVWRGGFLARMHRWSAAERDLRLARGLLTARGEKNRAVWADVDATLAWTLCRQHETAEGEEILAQVRARLNGGGSELRIRQAFIHEARATCHFRGGREALALRDVDAALALEAPYVGRVMRRADRRVLRARILTALNRRPEAEQELQRAERAFQDLELTDHPMLPAIDRARRELRTMPAALDGV